MKKGTFSRYYGVDFLILISISAFYLVPFLFILLTASKTPEAAGQLRFSIPGHPQLLQNLIDVLKFGNYRMVRALYNSVVITAFSIILTLITSALVAVVLQRRQDRLGAVVSSLMLAGLILPPAVVPTIFVFRALGIYKTLFSMILVNAALNMPFAILVMRSFMGTLPRELDEATVVDGASPLQLFTKVHLPLLHPAIVTVIVTSTVNIFNDFVGPLYFLPGNKNVTAPLTLFSFVSQFGSEWNLVFADVVVVAILPLIVFIFFQKQLVSGLVSGAIKG